MKPFVRRLLAVLAVLAVFKAADLGVAAMLQHRVDTSGHRLARLYAGNASADLLVLGNSRGVNAVHVPTLEKETGLTATNLAINGMGIRLARMTLEDYLEHNRTPRLVVVEISCMANGDGVIKDLKVFLGRSRRLEAAMREDYPKVYWASQVAASFRFNGEQALRIMHASAEADREWINVYTMTDAFAAAYRIPDSRRTSYLEIPESHWAELERILQLGREAGFEVQLYLAPYWESERDGMEGFPEFLARLGSTVEGRVRFFDASEALDRPELFADPVHPNLAGFQAMIPRLRDAGILGFDRKAD